jgi:hypothetical protein
VPEHGLALLGLALVAPMVARRRMQTLLPGFLGGVLGGKHR